MLDAETTVDATQRLLFGSARYCRVDWEEGVPRARCAVEYLIHADDLKRRDSRGFAKLERHARQRAPATDPGVPDAAWNMVLCSRRDFVEKVLRYMREFDVVVSGYNLPFDLSRLSLSWRVADNRRWRELDPFDGGFSLVLSNLKSRPDEENYRRSRVEVKTIDSKRHLIRLTRTGEPFRRGSLLDLHTLAIALSDRNYTLADAGRAFGVTDGKSDPGRHGVITHRYIDYNRRDVQATAALWERTMAELRRHPVELRANAAFSPASIGKAYLRAMGITPPAKRLGAHPKGMSWHQVLGAGMVAYYGGRAECRIRRFSVPVVPVDFTAMYPTIAILTGTWELLRAERIDATEESAEEVRGWIDRLDLDACFELETWRRLGALVQIVPSGDVLPVRARYASPEGPWGIGVNHLHSPEPIWYPLADAVASKLLTGRTPDIRMVIRISGSGMTSGIRSLELLGRVPLDPNDPAANLFRSLVEERRRVPPPGLSKEERDRFDRFPKTVANTTSYGIFAEMLRHELLGKVPKDLDVHGMRSFRVGSHAPEDPGEFSFPPLAAITTAGARLMLAMLERLVTGPSGRDGAYAFCDTDSMAVVATREGGLVECKGGPYPLGRKRAAVRALTWEEVDRIRDRFDVLSPYSFSAVPHLLKLTDENFADPAARYGQRAVSCFAISAKRYALSAKEPSSDALALLRTPDLEEEGEDSDAALDVVDAKEHGLAQLLNPTDPESADRDWIAQAWEVLIHGDPSLPFGGPAWLDRPAVSRITCSTPGLMDAFAGFNARKPYADAIKPFNFMLVAYVRGRAGYPTEVDASPFVLVAPYERNPARWSRMAWFNRYDPTHTPYRITAFGATGGHRLARVKTYREILLDYLDHAEAKSAGPDGKPSHSLTVGLLRRRDITTIRGLIRHIGKESNDLHARIHRLATDERQYLNTYEDSEGDPFLLLVLPVLKEMRRMTSVRAVADAADVPPSTVQDVLSGETVRARPGHRDKLTRAAGEFCREQLRTQGNEASRDNFIACAAYLTETGADGT